MFYATPTENSACSCLRHKFLQTSQCELSPVEQVPSPWKVPPSQQLRPAHCTQRTAVKVCETHAIFNQFIKVWSLSACRGYAVRSPGVVQPYVVITHVICQNNNKVGFLAACKLWNSGRAHRPGCKACTAAEFAAQIASKLMSLETRQCNLFCLNCCT